jgi:putative membrane protein
MLSLKNRTAIIVSLISAPCSMAAVSLSAIATESEDASLEAADFSDSQIAGAINASNEHCVGIGKSAQKSAKDPKVVAYADLMVKEHERINDEFAALLTKVNVKSEVSATSLGMQTELARDLATLGLLSGSSFDKKYVHQQTMFENHFIELLDSSLIPSAKNPEIKTYLQKIRAEHEKFLAQGQALQAEIGE